MKRLLEFPLEDGGSVVVEVDEPVPPGGVDRAAFKPREIADKARQTFEDALEKIKPAVGALLVKLRDIPQKPDEVEVEFGVKLSAEAGAVLASAGAEANFTVTLKWKGEPAKGE